MALAGRFLRIHKYNGPLLGEFEETDLEMEFDLLCGKSESVQLR